MRIVSESEWWQKGCQYCLDHKAHRCKYDECPYIELDDVKTYEEYLDNMGFYFDHLITSNFDIREDLKHDKD